MSIRKEHEKENWEKNIFIHNAKRECLEITPYQKTMWKEEQLALWIALWTPLGLWLKPKAVFNTGRAQSRRPFRVQNLPGTLLGQKFKAGSQKPTSLASSENLLLGNESLHDKPGFQLWGDTSVFNNLVEMLTCANVAKFKKEYT